LRFFVANNQREQEISEETEFCWKVKEKFLNESKIIQTEKLFHHRHDDDVEKILCGT